MSVPVHTIVLFIILAAGILCLHPREHIMKLVTGFSLSSRMARRMSLVAIILPMGVGWFRLYAERSGLFQTGSGHLETGLGTLFVTLFELYAKRVSDGSVGAKEF